MEKFVSKMFRRGMALLLCVVMLAPYMLPVVSALDIDWTKANTNEKTIYVIAGSDYQTGDSVANELSDDYRTERMDNMENISYRIAQSGIKVYGALFCGDYTQHGQYYLDSSATAANKTQDLDCIKEGISELKWYVNNRLGGAKQMIFVQGNHDRLATPGGAEGISKSGNPKENGKYIYDTPYYGVWVLNNNDYGWLGGKTQNGGLNMSGDLDGNLQDAVDGLKAYLEEKVKENYTKPIFIAAHTPLHYSYRTRAHGDAQYARKVVNALNTYGKKGLNIIYLFGHNHSAPNDSYIGGGAAYLDRGDTMYVSVSTDRGQCRAVPIEFTYMNAGYLGKMNNSNEGGNVNSMAVFEITGNKVVIKRYSANGMTQVRAVGEYYNKTANSTESYTHYGLTASQMEDYMNRSYKTVTVLPYDNNGNMGVKVEQPKYKTAYYQVTQFVNGNRYLIANWGESTHTSMSVLGGNAAKAVIKKDIAIQKNEQNNRGYFIELPAEANAGNWEWRWVHQSGHNTTGGIGEAGYLQNVQTTYYLSTTEKAEGYFSLQAPYSNDTDGMGLRTTSDASASTDNVLWVYDNTKRAQNSDNNYVHAGKPYGLAFFKNSQQTVRTSAFYLTRDSANGNDWSYRKYAQVSSTTDRGPTYIYARVNDHYDSSESSWVWAEGKSTINLVVGQFDNVSDLKTYLRRQIKVKKTTDGTTSNISDYTIQGTIEDITAAGTYRFHVDYNGQTLAVITVKLSEAEVTGIALDYQLGHAVQNAGATVETGTTMAVTYNNGVVVDIPLTVGMLQTADGKAVSTKDTGRQYHLSVVYDGFTYEADYTLVVYNKNHPTYPLPGSVKVWKGQDKDVQFDKTGAANIEIGATGVPMVEGVDVIVMVDTSSSMSAGTADGVRRDEATYAAINELIATLKTDIAAGVLGDSTKIAVADFNGYKTPKDGLTYATKGWGGYYALDGNAWVRDPGNPNNSQLHYSGAEYMNKAGSHGVRTGSGGIDNLTASAFVDVTKMKSNWANASTLPLSGGTNYDFAMDAIYQLGYNIKQYNKEHNLGDRELVVIFLSDGCPFQYNYWMSHANNGIWNDWLTGDLSNSELNTLTGGVATFQHFYNADGKHWMAEAIKGNPSKTYKVIRKSDEGLEGVIQNLKLSAGGEQYMGQVPGLGAQVHTIALGITGDNSNIKKTSMDHVLRSISSDPDPTDDVDEYYHNVNNSEELKVQFQQIATTIVQAATNSYFLDTMGEKFDLYMSNEITKSDGTVLEGVVPAIEVRDYIVSTGELDAVLERITFAADYRNAAVGTAMTVYQELLNEDGTYTKKTISMKMGDLLKGKYVCYNTSKTKSYTIEEFGKTITIKPETLFYKTSTLVNDKKFALNYYVYLEDALDNNGDNIAVDAGEYATNASAILYYKNFRNVDCKKTTTSPVLKWGQAKVSYGFYLVDENGMIIKNEKTGERVTYDADTFIGNKVQIGEGGSYTFDLNTWSPEIKSTDLSLPDGYKLYVSGGVTYKVRPISGESIGNQWTITGEASTHAKCTTCVQNYKEGRPDRVSKATSVNNTKHTDYNFTDTTVWFAVVAENKTKPDTVVVDFSLSVTVDVTDNDVVINTNGTLHSIGLTAPTDMKPVNGSNQEIASGFSAELKTGLKYGTAKIVDGKIVYTPNSMEMKAEEVIYYAIYYTGDVGTQGYYYGTLTIVPATTIYYEDSFVTYTAWNVSDLTENTEVKWTSDGDAKDAEQAQDRPGRLNENDANNIYGFDSAYANMTTYSMGSAMKFTANKNVYGEAQFTFWGTGFDVISLTGNTTGTISVAVYEADKFVDGKRPAESVAFTMVDTFYGYKKVLCDVVYEWDVTPDYPEGYWARVSAVETEKTKVVAPKFPENPKEGDIVEAVEEVWIVDENAENALYQVPVIKINGLEYKRYTAIITVYYLKGMDHKVDANDTKSEYDFYLDAIRIYDPANDGANSEVIKNAYADDHEGWPEYFELRNLLIGKNDFNGENDVAGTGIIFIDNNLDENGEIEYTVDDYQNFGPNNELYLAPGQSIAFDLDVPGKVDKIHVALKSVGSGAAKVSVHDAANTNKNFVPSEIKTATDLYYDISNLNGKTVVIHNQSDSTAILSITNVKLTYTTSNTDGFEQGFFTVNTEAAKMAVNSLKMFYARQEEETTEPETTEPETTEPETTEPETTESTETAPEKAETPNEEPASVWDMITNFVAGILSRITEFFASLWRN